MISSALIKREVCRLRSPLRTQPNVDDDNHELRRVKVAQYRVIQEKFN